MSTQRGNLVKKAPKHKNSVAFKNDLYDKSKKTKTINSMEHYGLCVRCKDIIEWKIKYKKYKLLTLPKKCVKCAGKKVLLPYYIVCQDCCTSLKVCSKCSKPSDELEFGESEKEKLKQEQKFQLELKQLTERKRRKFLRLLEKGELTKEDLSATVEKQKLDYEEGDSDFDEDDEDDKDDDDDDDDDEDDDEDSESHEGVKNIEKRIEKLSVKFKDLKGDKDDDDEGNEDDEEDENDTGLNDLKDEDDKDEEDEEDEDDDECEDSNGDYENEYEEELDEEEPIVYRSAAKK